MRFLGPQTNWTRVLFGVISILGLISSLSLLYYTIHEQNGLTLRVSSPLSFLDSLLRVSDSITLTPQQWTAYASVKERALEDIYSKAGKVPTNYYESLHSTLATILSDEKEDTDDLRQIPLDFIAKQILSDALSDSFDNIDNGFFKHTQSRSSYYIYLLDKIIMAHKPKCSPLSNKERGKNMGGKKFLNIDNPRFTEEFLRQDRVQLPDAKIKDLKQKHALLVKALRQLPLPPKKFFKGKGIVIPTSADFLPGALVTIGQLREMGSQLPVEVILNYEKDYDKDMCEVLLPKLNTECIVMERELTPDFMQHLKLKPFQLKSLSMLVSKFDHTIWLDADNAPIKNVDKIFDSDAYLENKFILWPDIWHLAVSPYYYEIAGREIGEVVRREGLRNKHSWEEYLKLDKFNGVAFSDLEGANPGRSAETGQMVFSKVEHFRALLLAIYYNIYGVSHYYRIFFQGMYGEGDRETFIAALETMKEPYFLTPYNVWFLGYLPKKNMLLETTIVQHDPNQAYHYTKKWRAWLKKKLLDTRLSISESDPYSRGLRKQFLEDHQLENLRTPEVMFLHIHKPKINPVANTDENINNHGIYTRRNLGKPGSHKDLKGKDWELKLHSIARWVVCDFLNPSYWDHIGKDKNKVCSGVSKYVDYLKQDTNDPKSENLNVLSGILSSEQ